MPKAKKRAISSSSESSDSNAAREVKAPEKPKKKNHAEKKAKTAATSSSDEQGKLKKLKKEKQEKPKEVQPVKEPEKKKLPVEKEPEKMQKTTTVKDMLRAKRDRDSQRKMEQGKPTSSGATTATDNDDDDGESESTSSLAISESSRESHPETAAIINGVKDIILPTGLPTDVLAIISDLKLFAELNPNAKNSFFAVEVLDKLVLIDTEAKKLGSNIRVPMFHYINQFIPCSKKTLLAKIRRHRVAQLENKVKSEISKLKRIVIDTIPASAAKHEQDLLKYEEMKKIQNVVGDTRPSTPPRKKYLWNDSSRLLLSEIVQQFQDLYKIAKLKNETQEQFVMRKLTELVIPLWPEGWVKQADFQKELERKMKKQNRALQSSALSLPQLQSKTNTASVAASTNGKAAAHPQKTEIPEKNNKLEVPMVNGKASSPKSSIPNAAATSVIKRSSDHSISSIISTTPSPPTTSLSLKAQDTSKARVIEFDKLLNPSDLLKTSHVKLPTPKFSSSPVAGPEKVQVESSDSSDCVEIVGETEFNPINPVKPSYHHNNNNNNSSKANHLPLQHHAPVAKKIRTHGSDDGEHETDYSKIIMGIQSLTVSPSLTC